jgi:hypothetical protein
MFFQDSTPDTSGYMIAGYTIAFIVMALYVASLYLRTRNLNQDITLLEEMEKTAPPVQPAAKREPRKSPARAQPKRSGKLVTKRSPKK